MSKSPSAPSPSPAGEKPPWTSYLWRGLALAAIVAAFLVLAGGLSRRAGPRGGKPSGPEAVYFPAPDGGLKPPGHEHAMTAPDSKEVLRRLLAGVLMAAAEEEGNYEHPDNQTVEGRRKAIADALGVPGFNPADQAPADMVPPDAQVLAVFKQPEREGACMVLVRFRKTVDQALADFHRHYRAVDGWQRKGEKPESAAPDANGRRGADRGWLVTFQRGQEWRFVFARPRGTDDETLAVIYDCRH